MFSWGCKRWVFSNCPLGKWAIASVFRAALRPCSVKWAPILAPRTLIWGFFQNITQVEADHPCTMYEYNSDRMEFDGNPKPKLQLLYLFYLTLIYNHLLWPHQVKLLFKRILICFIQVMFKWVFLNSYFFTLNSNFSLYIILQWYYNYFYIRPNLKKSW